MTAFRPRNPDFEAAARASFARQGMMATLGAAIERVAPGEFDLAMPFDARFTQQHGFLHAGAIASMLDTASGFAALTLMPADTGVLTVEFKLSLLSPARGARFRFLARVVKPGRTLVFTEAAAYAGQDGTGPAGAGPDGAGPPIAAMTATMMAIAGRDDVKG